MTYSEKCGMKIPVPGNYPSEYFDLSESQMHDLSRATNFLVLIDIHNYSKLCDSLRCHPDCLGKLVRNFFNRMEGNFFKLESSDFSVNKYLGDAILARFSREVSSDIVKRAIYLLNDFIKDVKNISTKFGLGSNLSVVMDNVTCLKGGVGGNLYYDYSYWGDEINRLFALTKHKEICPGYIWITETLYSALGAEQRAVLDKNYIWHHKEIAYEEKLIDFLYIEVPLYGVQI